MQKYRKIITGLIAVLIVASGFLFGILLISSNSSFEDVDAYDTAVSSDNLPDGAPRLPRCARDIDVVTRSGDIEKIAFTCDDDIERADFLENVELSFEWNVFVFNETHVELTRP